MSIEKMSLSIDPPSSQGYKNPKPITLLFLVVMRMSKSW